MSWINHRSLNIHWDLHPRWTWTTVGGQIECLLKLCRIMVGSVTRAAYFVTGAAIARTFPPGGPSAQLPVVSDQVAAGRTREHDHRDRVHPSANNAS